MNSRLPSNRVFLKDSSVWRGGITAYYLNQETNQLSIEPPDVKRKSLILQTHIASKFGGTTTVQYVIGPGDFPALLEAIASVMKVQ